MVTINVDTGLVLRSYKVEDAQPLFDAINASRSHLHPWLEWVDKTIKPAHSLQFIEQSIHQMEMQEALALGIFLNDKIVGGIGMHKWDLATRRAQIGYWLCADYQGQGIIHKCLVKFITFLFDKLGLNKIEIHFMPANKRSGKVAQQLGFKPEGIIRQSIIRNGLPQDVAIMGLLKSEWTLK